MVISIQFSFKMVISIQIQSQNDFDPIQLQIDFDSKFLWITLFCAPFLPSHIPPHPLTPSSILPHRLVKMKAVETENKNLKKDINKMKEDFECTRGLLDAQVCGWGCMVYGYSRMLPY